VRFEILALVTIMQCPEDKSSRLLRNFGHFRLWCTVSRPSR